MIDDPVPRGGYLYEMPRSETHEWYDRERGWVASVVNTVVYMCVCGYVHYLFGWKAAVMYAVYPLNVSGGAWSTGNYYMSTVLLCLAAYTVIGFIGAVGGVGWTNVGLATLGCLFYAAALNSTLLSVSFFVILSLLPWGWVSVVPLVGFLTGKRLRVGLRQRGDKHKEMGVHHGFAWQNLYNVPRVLGYYVYLTVWPRRLGFFHTFGKKEEHQTWKWNVLSGVLVILFGIWAWSVDWVMCVWWFVSIGVFSQWIILGQFVTERYTHLANVAWCVLLSQFLPFEAFLVVCTLYFCRSMGYLPAWRSNERLFGYGTVQFPECGENWVNYGSYYIDRGDKFSAIKPLLMAERTVKGDKYGIYVDLANCYASGGFYQKALDWTNKALEVATKDKVGGMIEQRNELERKIYKMQRGQKELKRMGVI